MTGVPPAGDVGIVVIGRNEGPRLEGCLRSVRGQAQPIVYVDSGSTDGSPERARALGVDVVELDRRGPFTMARGRNAGFAYLLRVAPRLRYVQFLDGDCELRPGWLAVARRILASRPEVAAVCGRRREFHPHASVYNRLVDMEWDVPAGESAACGGDALMRVDALWQVHGYNEALIAGEEPELCLRLRGAGWKILRSAAEMTRHDAAITRFGQWWKRGVRTGHAYAAGAALHGWGRERYRVAHVRRAVTWGLVAPALLLATVTGAAAGARWLWGVSAVLVLGHGAGALRVYSYRRRHGRPPTESALAGAFTALGKFAEGQGVLHYLWQRLRHHRPRLIEYKDQPAPVPVGDWGAPEGPTP